MYKYKPEGGVPVYSWIPEHEHLADEGMVSQIENLSKLPFAFHHIAQMPDGHLGYGMPIGGVLATEGVVVPNAVGVDIGCGMCAVKTYTHELGEKEIRSWMSIVRELIPVGLNHHKTQQAPELMPSHEHVNLDLFSVQSVVADQYLAARYQIGTLGGGNHFIELQRDGDGFIWIMIHSGSRNLGYKVAKKYNDEAIQLNQKWHSTVPKSHQLAFLPTDSHMGKMYLSEMQYCVKFAQANRLLMMSRAMDALCDIVNNAFFDPPIHIAHNYASMENHYGKNVMVHRKGATLARKGTIGIIPGSQGTSSYIVEGKGNHESFMSCSHGAGRVLGRKQAIATLDMESEVRGLEANGIIHSIRNRSDLDEAPGAYKDIDSVMANQTDLVEIRERLTPLAVIKG